MHAPPSVKWGESRLTAPRHPRRRSESRRLHLGLVGAAGAVQAAVLGAAPTGLLESLPERLAGSVPPDLQVVGRHAEASSGGVRALRSQLHGADQLRIL